MSNIPATLPSLAYVLSFYFILLHAVRRTMAGAVLPSQMCNQLIYILSHTDLIGSRQQLGSRDFIVMRKFRPRPTFSLNDLRCPAVIVGHPLSCAPRLPETKKNKRRRRAHQGKTAPPPPRKVRPLASPSLSPSLSPFPAPPLSIVELRHRMVISRPSKRKICLRQVSKAPQARVQTSMC